MDTNKIQIRATILNKPRSVLGRIGLAISEKTLGEKFSIVLPNVFATLPHNVGYRRALLLAKNMTQRGWCKNITRNYQLPDEPFLYSYSALPQEHEASGGWGADFFDETTAFKRTLSEFLERFLWRTKRIPKNQTQMATVKEMEKSWAFPLHSLAGYSQEQRDSFPFLTITQKDSFHWVRVCSLLSPRQKRWCPLQLVSGAHFHTVCNQSPIEKLLRESTTNGLATSWISRDEALLRGLLELIERDAFAITWTRGITPPRVRVPLNPLITKRLKRAKLEPIFLSIPTDFPVHVVAAIILDKTKKSPAMVLGMKASFNLEDAGEGALREALSIRHELLFKSLWSKENPPIEQCTSRLSRLAAWSKPENLAHLDFLLSGAETNAETNMRTYSVKEQLSILKSVLKKEGCQPFFYDFTHSLQKKLHSVLVIVPELMPIQIDSDIPYCGAKRLTSVPEKLNLKSTQEINHIPHPLA